MKLLAVQSKSAPEDIGYHDWGFLIDKYEHGLFMNGNVSATANILWRGVMSAQPNENRFKILKDGFVNRDKDNLINVPMSAMTLAHRSWCSKCSRTYCKNCVLSPSVSDPRINCRLYARLACNVPGEFYLGEFMADHRHADSSSGFGKCILVNKGLELPSTQPSSVQNGERYSKDARFFKCKEIFVHKGYTVNSEGSAGCLTIPPSDADIFFSYFSDKEQVRIELFDFLNFHRANG